MARERESYVRDAMQFAHRVPHEQLEEMFNRYHWLPWQYTQIVGYVELRLVDEAIKAYYWYVDAKRISARMQRKPFVFAGKLIDVCDDVHEKDNVDEGSRTKAAIGASNYGLSLKVSSDGDITVYVGGKELIRV